MPTGAFNICCPRDCVSRTANVERTGRHKWIKSRGKECWAPVHGGGGMEFFEEMYMLNKCRMNEFGDEFIDSCGFPDIEKYLTMLLHNIATPYSLGSF